MILKNFIGICVCYVCVFACVCVKLPALQGNIKQKTIS